MHEDSWLPALRRYLAASLAGHAIWEALQLPLFTIWHDGTVRQIAFATLHCLAGDLVIASSALVAALLLLGRPGWPRYRRFHVAAAVLAFGITYTAWSEFNNAIIKRTWTYTDAMPLVPGLRIGLAPVLQWVLVPMLALIAASRSLRKPSA